MSRRSAGSTAALLQRASSQLKGERVVQASDEDDLQAYINSLTKRTAPKKSLSFEEDSEISISNEDFQYGGADIPVTASRFLKKKGDVADSLDSVESIGPRDSLQRKFLKKKVPGPAVPGTSPIPANRPSTARGSSRNSVASGGFSRPGQSYNQKPSVLNKAEALATKISQRPAPTRQANFSLDTDSEESPRKPAAAARPVHSRSPSPMRSATDSSMSLGRDGGKFVKRKSDPPPPPDFLTSQNAAKSEQKSKPKPSPRNSLTSAKGGRKLVGNLMLSSEEESLAEFIEGLSGSEVSLQRSSSPGKRGGGGVPVRSSPSPEQKPLGRAPSPSHHPKHSPFKRTSSPASNSGLHARSMSDESLHSDTMYTKADTVSMEEEDQFNVNVVMDLDTLGPVMSLDLDNQSPLLSPKKPASVTPSPSPFFKSQSGTPTKQKKTPAAKSDIYSNKKSSKKESKSKGVKPESELLSNFGLHTVDELMGLESKGSKDSSKDMSVVSDISEILTDKPSNMFKASRPVQDSIAEGISEVETRADVKEQYSYSEQFDSISEKIGEDSSLGQTASEVETQYSDEDSKKNDKKDYTDDFASASETDVESYSDSYTSNTDSRTYSYTRSSFSVSQSKNAVGKKSVEVQTGDQPGLTYQWNTHHSGMAFMGPSFGLSYTDPTPIATHTVSPEALEALTTYSPAMLALHDMLKQQLELTQTFIQAQHYLYSSYTRSIEPEHKYTTLEDTKQYIKKHRKPRLTFKEALKLVDREMK